MLEQQARCYSDMLRPELADHGVHLVGWDELTDEQETRPRRVFDTEISPVLTPLGLDAAHPFPFVSNLSTSWAFRLQDPASAESVLVRLKVPSELPQWLRVRAGVAPGAASSSASHEVIAANASSSSPAWTSTSASLFRVCRDAEVELDDDGRQSKRALVEESCGSGGSSRSCGSKSSRTPIGRCWPSSWSASRSTPDDVYEMTALLDYTTLFQIAGLDIEPLRDPPWTPLPPTALEASTATSSPRSAPATSSCTIHTRASTRASSDSSARPPTIRRRSRSR